MLGLGKPNAFLLPLLCAGSWYGIVPAAMQPAVPEANPVPVELLSWSVPFPLTIRAGMPLTYCILGRIW